MNNRWIPAAAIAAITVTGFLYFPGRTWVQQDSQVYVAILEHLRDPSVLRNDILAAKPHVSYTVFDELALGLRRLTGLGFEAVLGGMQLLARALGAWGVYLMALACGLRVGPALLATGILSLGAVVAGPTVLTVEYDPIPRGVAVPLLLLAAGLAARRGYLWAGVCGTAAFLTHPTTVWPFWGVYTALALWPGADRRARLRGLLPLAAGIAVLYFISRNGEPQLQAGALDAVRAQVLRLRASYVWVSTWAATWMPHYALLCLAGMAAWWRVREKTPLDLRVLLGGMAAAGLLSVPLSWWLLEGMNSVLVPRLQPARALLFVVVAAQFGAAVAGAHAAAAGRRVEAFGWFALAYLPPAVDRLTAPPAWNRAAAVILLAALAAYAAGCVRRKWAPLAVALAIAAGFAVLPGLARIENYPRMHTPELAELAAWANSSTRPDAVFLFPDARYTTVPGIFRVKALRALYVDWKTGGQMNYFGDLGDEWWRRWQAVGRGRYRPEDVPKYAALGIDYIVLPRDSRPPGLPAVFENSGYRAYALRPLQRP